MTIHKSPHPLAGRTVKVGPGEHHDMQGAVVEGAEFRVEDWVDRTMGGSWMDQKGNPACLIYGLRVGASAIPIDNEAVYGKIGPFGHIVHVTEIEEEK